MVCRVGFEAFEGLADFDVFRARADRFRFGRGFGAIGFGFSVFELVGGGYPPGVDGAVEGGRVASDFGGGFGGGRRRFTTQFDPVEEHLLYRFAFDRDAPVRPHIEAGGVAGRRVVVVARVARLDPWVRLGRLRDQRGRQWFVFSPAFAVVFGDPCEALVVFAIGRIAPVIPACLDDSARRDAQRRHPLRFAGAVGVQAQRFAPVFPVVGGTDVEDVAFVFPFAVRGVDVVDDFVRTDGRLTPAGLAPDRRDRREVASPAGRAAGDREGRAHRRRSPAGAAVGRAVHVVALPGVACFAAVLVLRDEEHDAFGVGAAGQLDVAPEARVHSHGRAPAGSVVGVGDLQRAPAAGEVVERDVHPPVVGAFGVVVDPHRLTVVGRAFVDAGADAPGFRARRGPKPDALAPAAGGQIAREPLFQLLVVDDDRVAVVGPMAGERRGRTEAGEAFAPVGRDRRSGVVRRAFFGAPRVVVGDDYRFSVAPDEALGLGDVGIGFGARDDVDVAAGEGARAEQGFFFFARAGARRQHFAVDEDFRGMQVLLVFERRDVFAFFFSRCARWPDRECRDNSEDQRGEDSHSLAISEHLLLHSQSRGALSPTLKWTSNNRNQRAPLSLT